MKISAKNSMTLCTVHLRLPGGFWPWRNAWLVLSGRRTGCQKAPPLGDTLLELSSFRLRACVFFSWHALHFVKFSKIWLTDLKGMMAKGVQDRVCVCETEVIGQRRDCGLLVHTCCGSPQGQPGYGFKAESHTPSSRTARWWQCLQVKRCRCC